MSGESWQLMPALSEEDLAALKADIAVHGMQVPVVVDADSGEIVDGHHRVRAWSELRAEGRRVPDYPRDVRRFRSDDERIAFVVSANLFRRHLNRAERAEVVARLRGKGWSLRRIGEAVGVDHTTVRDDLAAVGNPTPARIEGADQKSYPARRPPGRVIVASARDEQRARSALSVIGEGASGMIGLARAEERAREARMAKLRESVVPPRIEGNAYELRLGDLRDVWADIADGSIDAIVTDPPYTNELVWVYEDLARLAVRVLRPGRLAAIYCGNLRLDDEIELLRAGGLSYIWHGVNVLSGRHTKVRARKVNGNHRIVLLCSPGDFTPRRWIHDTYLASGRGGPETRPDHPWQQAIDTMRHWVLMTSEPGEVVFDPFIGSGTCALAAVEAGRRFLGGDIDSACVETTRRRLEELVNNNEEHEARGDLT